MTTTPSSRPRNGGRRESTSSITTTGRVRKNSVSATSNATNGNTMAATAPMRPRANTLSHIDSSTLEMLAQANANAGHNASRGGIASIGASFTCSRHGPPMPKLNTSTLGGLDLHGPISAGPTLPDLGPGELFFGTINPAALHYSYSPQQQPIGTPTSPFGAPYGLDSHYSIDEYDDDGLEWMHGLNQSLEEGGSPSAISTTSQSAVSEVMLDSTLWNSLGVNSSINYDFSQNFNDTPPPPGTVSPRSLMAQAGEHSFYTTPPPVGAISPSSISHSNYPPQFSNYTSGRSASSSTSLGSGTSLTSLSAESITDATRAALVATLNGSSTFGATHLHQNRRRYSTSAASSPMTASLGITINLPPTRDLQRFVSSYIKHFHPHLPFLHIPTLNFDSPMYTNTYKIGHHGQRSGINGGGGCLVLSIAAIGALYEYEIVIAKELFEAAKKTVQIFLEDRRKADVTAAMNGINNSAISNSDSSQNTPVWLVQAMLLNVIFGLHCGDKVASEIAMNHCAALVSLARAAGLTRSSPLHQHTEVDVSMGDLEFSSDWNGLGIKTESDDHAEWSSWAAAEERKRTLYAVHLLSSLLVAAHNMQPSLMNNEIRLDLPCDEDLWAADSATLWQTRGGAALATSSSVGFSNALNTLLSTGQQTQFTSQGNYNHFGNQPGFGLKLSSFGCLVLICALHVYIWESRQRQHSRNWTAAEAENMHARIEPALKAWWTAWMCTHGNGSMDPKTTNLHMPLSVDAIPLLNLAYIRLFVDMGRSKEAFWARDFDLMAEELATGWEYGPVTNALLHTFSPSSASSVSGRSESPLAEISPALSPSSATSSPNLNSLKISATPTHQSVTHSTQPSKRETHLKKAVVYAIDALSHNDVYGPFAATDTPCRDSPIQTHLCTLDCAQVLAEWVATVQERVGPYMGILGSEECNLESLEGMMVLEADDRKLLMRVMELARSTEVKLSVEWNLNASQGQQQRNVNIPDSGLGSKILRVHACLLETVIIWPGKKLRIPWYIGVMSF